MKRIFIFPTIEEAKAFILTQPRDPVFVAGVGAAEIAAATIRAVKARKPQLVVLAGIAGAYDRSLQRGEVVEVVSERIAGIPARYAREYETSGPDLGLPLAAGVTVNRSGDGLRETGRKQEQEFRETGYGIPVPETKSGDAVSAPAGQTLQPAGEARCPESTARTGKARCPKSKTWRARPFSPCAKRWASPAARFAPCRTMSANPSTDGPEGWPSKTLPQH